MPKFFVSKNAEKYDNIGNVRNDGLYHNYIIEIQFSEKEFVYVSHQEYFDNTWYKWEKYGLYNNIEIEKPDNLNEYKEVTEKECSSGSSWCFYKKRE